MLQQDSTVKSDVKTAQQSYVGGQAMAFQLGEDHDSGMNEMNLIPLIDIMLVLMIIFWSQQQLPTIDSINAS